MKIAVITCYFMPDYVRARTIREALTQIPGIKPIVIKNKRTGLLRYPEVLWRLWQVKRNEKPDVYLLTFRGQELLPFVLAIAGKKPVIFDEFIVPTAYATAEPHRRTLSTRIKYFLVRVSEPFYKWWLHRCSAILADTQAHAELSARLTGTNLSKYLALPVGTDDAVFTPGPAEQQTNETFRVFYYSTGMQPLHGVPIVLEAAKRLKTHTDIEFLFAGGKRPMRQAVEAAKEQGANVRYERWIPFAQLVNTIRSASLCLGGPFGDTQQAQHVITGKTYQFLACAVPVLIGESLASKEFFVDRNTAIVVPQGDAAALVRAIKWAKDHPAELRTMAINGRKLYEKQFSTEAISRLLQPLVSGL